MAGAASGEIHYLVFTDGGVGGVGETLRRVDWARVTLAGKALSIDADPAALPTVERDQWPAR
jgi:hypothetical protein